MALSFGKYQLIEKLASGGMGEVFLARTAGIEKLLVLKRILPHLAQDKEFLDLFLDEARIAARLNHPNLTRIIDLGDVGGAWFLVMEHVAGKDLRQIAMRVRNKRQQLPLGFVCRIVADAAAGLHYAHRATDAQGRPMHIVHRDVSPHNVLISYDGDVKLIDFGVAKAVGRIQQTEAGVLRGKYPYMSPEHVTSGEVDHRSDQFSLGVVLWELLTGSRLFKAQNDALTLDQVAECKVEAPSRKIEPLPARLIEISMRALQKDPNDRYADIDAFRVELEELLIAQQWKAGNADLGKFVAALFVDEGVPLDDESASAPTQSVRSVGSNSGPADPGASLSPPDAVALFVQTARTARPAWRPTEVERADIEALIHQLYGMPLAIELAAARSSTLSPAQLRQQLPRVDVSVREESVGAAIAWTFDLLQGHEQLALAQLSVVPGGFTIEEAEAVVWLSRFPKAPWALDVVQGLRDRALVRAEEAAGGELRFLMPPDIRAFALAKLAAMGPDEGKEARGRHVAWLGRVTPR